MKSCTVFSQEVKFGNTSRKKKTTPEYENMFNYYNSVSVCVCMCVGDAGDGVANYVLGIPRVMDKTEVFGSR